ncbi:MAG TPA: hypothetical protein VGT00_15295 [Methylomirabilota bacterium]|nr:hypothetical protein [Methylomirabilota bacterium]
MIMISMMPRLLLASGAAPLCIFMLSIAPAVYAQENTGAGLVMTVDVERNALTLETRSGSKAVLVAPTAAIRDDHGQALAFGDIRPGDAVVYQVGSGSAVRLHVARQFWAMPTGR